MERGGSEHEILLEENVIDLKSIAEYLHGNINLQILS